MAKKYKVNFDMRFSHDVVVTAKNKVDAKNKAFAKLYKKLSKKYFNISVDES